MLQKVESATALQVRHITIDSSKMTTEPELSINSQILLHSFYTSFNSSHFTEYGFNDTDEHRLKADTKLEVGDYLFYSRAVSGPNDDLYSFYRILKITPKQVVIEERLYNGAEVPQYQQIRLKKHEHTSAIHGGKVYHSYRSGRWHFSQVMKASEHRTYVQERLAEIRADLLDKARRGSCSLLTKS